MYRCYSAPANYRVVHLVIFIRKYFISWLSRPLNYWKQWPKKTKIWHHFHALYALGNFTHMRDLQSGYCVFCKVMTTVLYMGDLHGRNVESVSSALIYEGLARLVQWILQSTVVYGGLAWWVTVLVRPFILGTVVIYGAGKKNYMVDSVGQHTNHTSPLLASPTQCVLIELDGNH